MWRAYMDLSFNLTFFEMIWWRVSASASIARLYMHRGVSEGDVPGKFYILKLESCNLVNTFLRKFKAGDE